MPWTPHFTEDQVRDAVENSFSMTAALRRLGLRPAGGNFRTLKKLTAYYGIPWDHFDPYRAVGKRREAKPLHEVLVENSLYKRETLKRRLYNHGLKRRQCELCGQGQQWQGRRMSLILDHINGVPTDNRLENLRIVCPNCNATLETHCGRKNRRTVVPRLCACCGGEFPPKRPEQQYCSRACGWRAEHRYRKVPRPAYEQLKADLESMSVVAVGRKYGVTDNAIRKWVRWYEQGNFGKHPPDPDRRGERRPRSDERPPRAGH